MSSCVLKSFEYYLVFAKQFIMDDPIINEEVNIDESVIWKIC
jgi:hypothetical protein